MKPSRTYPSVNAMLRATLPRKHANAIIDGSSDLIVAQNIALSAALQELLESCTSEGPATVCCPDRNVRNRARRALRRHGVVIRTAKGSSS